MLPLDTSSTPSISLMLLMANLSSAAECMQKSIVHVPMLSAVSVLRDVYSAHDQSYRVESVRVFVKIGFVDMVSVL